MKETFKVTKEYVIPMNGFIGLECVVCKIIVRGRENVNGAVEPVSNYWNIERQEVYCCAEHMLVRHTNTKT